MDRKRINRLDVYPSDALLASIDAWRRTQPDLPSRAEAVRRLVEKALRAEMQKRKPKIAP